jgi:hypothetical protein
MYEDEKHASGNVQKPDNRKQKIADAVRNFRQ